MIVDCAVYEDGERRTGPVDLADAAQAATDREGFVWLGLHEPSAEEFDAVQREFALHELAVEDAIKAHQRPKLEVYGDTLLLVLKPARYHGETDDIELGEILLFVGEGFVVSVRHGAATALGEVRRAVERSPEHLRRGPEAVPHRVRIHVGEVYVPLARGLQEK